MKLEIDTLYQRHAEVICDDELERWPDFYTDDCVYKLVSRENFDRGLPLAHILAESRGALVDRVVAIRKTMVYAPRVLNHTVSGIRIVELLDGVAVARSMIAVHQTLGDGSTRLQMVARSFDRIGLDGDAPRFAQRIVVFDSELVPGSIVYPI